MQKNLSKHWLEGVHYAVFGLGDSGYQKYNVISLFTYQSNIFLIYAFLLAMYYISFFRSLDESLWYLRMLYTCMVELLYKSLIHSN